MFREKLLMKALMQRGMEGERERESEATRIDFSHSANTEVWNKYRDIILLFTVAEKQQRCHVSVLRVCLHSHGTGFSMCRVLFVQQGNRYGISSLMLKGMLKSD